MKLNQIMRMNAASCLLFGLVFIAIPGGVAGFLSGQSPAPAWLVATLGAILLVNAAHLLWAARIPRPGKKLVMYFSAGDFLWVMASIFLVLTGTWITTLPGIAVSIAVACLVGFFGVMQFRLGNIKGHK